MNIATIRIAAEGFINNSIAKKSVLLNSLLKNIDDTLFAQTSIIRKVDSMKARALAIDSQIATTTSEISTYTTIIASLPAGAIKDDFIEKKTLAEQDLFRLNVRAKSAGGQALVLEEIKMNLLTDKASALLDINGVVNAIVATNP